MSVNSSIAHDAYLSTLTAAVLAFQDHSVPRPPVDVVVSALLEAETTAKKQRIDYPFTALLGHWRLCFATGTRKVRQRGGIVLGKGWYVPRVAIAQISFQPSQQSEPNSDQGEIGNQARLGQLAIQFTGPCKYLGKKNLLAFDFTQLQVSLFGRTLYRGKVRSRQTQTSDFSSQPISTLPFFAFFLVTEDFIAARGRGGGLALWVRDSSLQPINRAGSAG